MGIEEDRVFYINRRGFEGFEVNLRTHLSDPRSFLASLESLESEGPGELNSSKTLSRRSTSISGAHRGVH